MEQTKVTEETKEQKYGIFRRLFCYVRSHIWCSFAAVIFAAILLILLILLFYMRQQYYNFLMKSTYATEEALLDTVQESIGSMLDDFVSIGANICVDTDLMYDTDLRASIEEFAASAGGAEDKQRIKSALKVTGNLSNSIVGVAIADENGILYQYDKYDISGTTKVDLWNDEQKVRDIFSEMRELNAENRIPRYLVVTAPDEHPNVPGKGIVNLAFPFRNGYSYREIPYIMLLSFSLEPMEEVLGQLTAGQMDYVQAFLQDESEIILLHTDGREHIGENAEIYQGQSALINLSAGIKGYGWELHAIIDSNRILEKVDANYRPVLLLCFLVIFLIFVWLFWACNRILRPIHMIRESITRVQNGARKERIPIMGTNEIWRLAASYNRMLNVINQANEKMEYQHEQVIENMRMKQRAEREALESQINAHFICNTLNVINYEAIESGNYKISVLLKKLSNILRYTFDQKHQNVYMRQEIVWIEQYLYLQKERLETVFDYEISFDSDYDSWPCRKLMLQPFVENSIHHGFEGMREGGRIWITGEGYREFLKITIRDNGCEMDAGRRTVIQEIIENPQVAKTKEVGIGISNVIARMRMYYGDGFEVQFETEEGEGTRFVFILPLPAQNEDAGGKRNAENFDR